jgi:hypothetical protein
MNRVCVKTQTRALTNAPCLQKRVTDHCASFRAACGGSCVSTGKDPLWKNHTADAVWSRTRTVSNSSPKFNHHLAGLRIRQSFLRERYLRSITRQGFRAGWDLQKHVPWLRPKQGFCAPESAERQKRHSRQNHEASLVLVVRRNMRLMLCRWRFCGCACVRSRCRRLPGCARLALGVGHPVAPCSHRGVQQI